MRNLTRMLTGWVAALLLLGASLAGADDQNVVSLTCRSMEVQKAISILRTVSDLRVVIDPKVPRKRITLSFKDLPAEDALKTVVTAAGLTYRKIGNAYVVEPKGASTLAVGRARAALRGESAPAGAGSAAPGIGGGIVRPDALPAPGSQGGAIGPREAPVAISPAVLDSLDRPVDVDVKNGPLASVTEQLSRSAGIKVTADPALASGLVVTVGLHGIPLTAALELVAGQTGLQISPSPEGVTFVRPGLSLDTAQVRARRTPAGARRVEQGQLWTAEWANVLTSGFSAFGETSPVRSLRRQPGTPDGRPLQLRPRRGGLQQLAPTDSPAPVANAKAEAQKPRSGSTAALSVTCPHCGHLVPTRVVLKCAQCGRLLSASAVRCPACGGKPVRTRALPARCPHCHKLLITPSNGKG